MTVIGVHSRHNHRHNVALTSASSHGFKYMVVGLVVGLVVGMQVMLVQVNKKGEPFVNSSGHASAASTALFGGEPELRLEHRVEQAVAAAEREVREQEAAGRWAHQPANFPKSLPEGALEHEVRSPGQPWPKPLTPLEVAHWLDVLGKYTQKAAALNATQTREIKRRSVDNPLRHLTDSESRPVNIKEWVEQGKCEHVDMYLAQILDRLQPWSNGGISRGMIEEAVRKGRERTNNFGGLHYQFVDGNVYARSEGNELYIERYAGLFANTLKSIVMPNIELALHNGHDLPVMRKHEVHPMFAYASTDAFNEILVPCPWYILKLAASIAADSKWAPKSLEEFRAQTGKVFWRGSPNDFLHYTKENFRFAPRVKLVEEGMEHPELVDAQITSSLMLLSGYGWEVECVVYAHFKLAEPEGVNGTCSQENVGMYRKAQEAKSAPINNQDNGFRYALNMDGTGVSERLAQQLSSSQLVFKVDSPFYNYYSRFFVPYVHYIPVKYDLSDLPKKVAWANEHVEEAHAIMVRASTLAHRIFHPDEVTCYTGLAMAAYGRLLGFEPQLREDVSLFE